MKGNVTRCICIKIKECKYKKVIAIWTYVWTYGIFDAYTCFETDRRMDNQCCQVLPQSATVLS